MTLVTYRCLLIIHNALVWLAIPFNDILQDKFSLIKNNKALDVKSGVTIIQMKFLKALYNIYINLYTNVHRSGAN